MTDSEVREFCDRKKWDWHSRQILLTEFNNRLRPNERAIGFNDIRTPCRLRQILGSLKHRLMD